MEEKVRDRFEPGRRRLHRKKLNLLANSKESRREKEKEIDMQTRQFNNFLFHGKFDTVVDPYRFILLCNVSQLFVTNCPKCHS
jgi:hypothetical protein